MWLKIDLIVFLIVAVFSGFFIPQILLIAFRKNLFDEQDPRKIHKGAVPRLGGIAFFPTILFSLLLMIGVCRQYFPETHSEMLQTSITALCFYACAVVVLYMVGMADDLIGLKYRAKFIAQIFAAAMVTAGGVCILNLHGFFGIYDLPIVIGVCFTMLITVFIINSINLIDGIDGLASGLSAIACIFYGYIFSSVGMHIYAMLMFATLGALAPFFYYNVYGNVNKHKKIFMGDTGALTIGLTLSVCAVRICMIPDEALHGSNPVVLAFAPLLIPCLDVVRVYIHRIRAGRNPFLPDKSHIHHKLLALGLSQRVAMPVILAASILLTALNWALADYVHITILFLADVAIWIFANMLLGRAIRARSRRLNIPLYD